MIRLATAHSKLRLATHVEISDIELAYKLLKMTIFNEPFADDEEKVNEAADQEMVEESEAVRGKGAAAAGGKDDVIPLKQQAGRAMRSRRRGAQEDAEDPQGDDDGLSGPSASKRARVDHGEQVKALFGANAPVVFDQ